MTQLMKTKVTILLALVFTAINLSAKTFYDFNSGIIGVTGAYDRLIELGYEGMVENNNVQLPALSGTDERVMLQVLNNNGIGKKVLDFLFQKQADGSLSEELLKERALKSARFADVERSKVGLIDSKTILKEDYLPILKNNFILIVQGDLWYVFHVDIDEKIWNDVFASWNDPRAYDRIKVNVSFRAKGKKALKPQKFIRKLALKVPELAIRGQVISRNPFLAEIREKAVLGDGDRFFTYRQKQNSKGELYSSKVSTVRATLSYKEGEQYMYTIAGGEASASKGDIVVYKPDMKQALSLTGHWMKGSRELSLTWDYLFGMTQTGKSLHFLVNAGVGGFEGHRTTLYEVEGKLYKSPTFANLGIGLGYGMTFLHRIQVMPYIYYLSYEGIFTMPYSSSNYNDDQAEMDWTHIIRFPIGLRVNVNLWYPLQLTAGVQYNLNVLTVSMNEADRDESEKASNPHLWNGNARDYILEPRGWKRSGLNIYAGLRVCF